MTVIVLNTLPRKTNKLQCGTSPRPALYSVHCRQLDYLNEMTRRWCTAVLACILRLYVDTLRRSDFAAAPRLRIIRASYRKLGASAGGRRLRSHKSDRTLA